MNLAPRHQTHSPMNQSESADHNYTNNGIENKQNNPKVKKHTVTPEAPYHGAYRENVTIGVGGSSQGVSSPFCVLSSIHNRITIDNGTFLAKSPTKLNPYFEVNKSTSGNMFLDFHINLFCLFFNKNKLSKRFIECLDSFLANLLNAYSTMSQLLYSRRGSNCDYRYVVKVVDYLAHHGYVLNIIGKDNEYQGNSSWLIPTSKLCTQFESFKIRAALKKNSPMIEVRDKDKKPLSLNRFKRRQARLFRESSEPVQVYNNLWLKHDATLNGRVLIPFMKRKFNGDLNHGGRFYDASHLVLSKELRPSILIDGEPTVEPDFKAMHFAILYALAGIQLEDDPYMVEGFERKTIKLVSLVLLNSEDLERFKANVTKSGNPKVKAAYDQYQKDRVIFLQRSSQGLSCKEPNKPKSLHGFIEGMPDGIQGSELLEAINQRHNPIAHLFGTDKIGLKLQNKDSRIMARTITTLARKDIPVLPVHDSVRCRESDLEAVCEAMRESFKSEAGFSCTIDY